MLPPPPPDAAPAEGRGRASGAREVPRPQGAEAPDSGDAERFIWPADRLADEDDTVDVVSLFDLTAEEATSLGLTLRAAPQAPGASPHARDVPARETPAEGQGRASAASEVPRPQGAASTLRTMRLRAIDQDRRDERATGAPAGVSAVSAGGDGAPGHGAGGVGPASPGASADEGLKDMRVDVVAASGTLKGDVQPADVERPSVERPAQRAAVDTTAEAAVPVSSQREATAGDTLEPGSLGDSPALVTPGASSATAPELGVDPALLDAFAEESAELLDGLHVELEHLESNVDDQGALLETRRIIHTIKGGAKMCGFELVALLTHACENLLDLIADGVAPLDGQNLRALFECEPLLRAAVQDALTGGGANLDGVATLAARFDAYCLARGPREAARDERGASPATMAIADLSPASETDVPPAGSVRSGSLPTGDGSGADVADTAAEGPATATAVSKAHAVHAVSPETDTVGADGIRPSSSANGAGEGSTGATASTPSASGDPARPRWHGTHDVGSPRSGSERGRGREAQRGGRNANSINVDLSKVDAVVAKVTELAAHRVSSQGMIGQLLATSEDARRNVVRLHSVAMQLSNECTSILPEETTHDDLDLERYTTLNTLVLQLQEAVSDQQALVQAFHDTITSHWSLQATESRVDADIQNALMSIRLVPLGSLRVRLDGVVRQAAEATGKVVRWQLQGSSVAVEKNVFDRLFEPLMHLLRNAVDHGLERGAERRAAGKPEAGTITVTAAQEGNHIVITVADDGRGIVANKVAALAVERGLITAEQAAAMTHQQKVGLIFTPGFSTAAKVSHISGRGVGMDAVREACLRMGGTLDVSSRPGAGTTFTMRLPLSLSVTRGLIIRDGGCLMVLPVAQVVALHLVSASDVVEVPGGRIARIDGQELPIYNLPPLAGAVPASYVQNGEINVLQLAHADGSIGVVIEDVLGEEEILIKAPPALLRGVKTLLGAYVLPDGRVAPVVNMPQLLADLRPVATLTAPKDERKSGELRALVVDDSMSMRVALSGTLQNAGFSVLTARDGQEALEVLKREGLPSLVTLDVEMPRMDGLETLFAIRQMAGAEELPVFMMTSRGGTKHRRAAEQLGATRYFTKPYRDSELATAARAVCTDARAP
jgi:chemosensory pili system protein ChpA (sensor histidine kinase/response regulator)